MRCGRRALQQGRRQTVLGGVEGGGRGRAVMSNRVARKGLTDSLPLGLVSLHVWGHRRGGQARKCRDLESPGDLL